MPSQSVALAWLLPVLLSDRFASGEPLPQTSLSGQNIHLANVSSSSTTTSSPAGEPLSVSVLSTAKTSSTAIGDYVAHGLGLNAVLSPSSPPPPTSSPETNDENAAPSGPSATNSSDPRTSVIIITTTSTAPPKTTFTITNDAHPNSTKPQNLTLSGDCWDQWNEYWSYSAVNFQEFMTEITTTKTTIYPELATTLEFGTYTYTTTLTFESVAKQGAFPTATYTSFGTQTYTETLGPGYTWTSTFTTGKTSGETVITTTAFGGKGPVTAPACALPSIVPQCQSLWDAWVDGDFPGIVQYNCSNTQSGPCASEKDSFTKQFSRYEAALSPVPWGPGPTPICSQASVKPNGCSSLVKSLLTVQADHEPRSFDAFPSDSVLAPGCTVGCQTCAITGKSVQLYYWPPKTATPAKQSIVAKSTITTAPKPATQVSMHNGTQFTFTSPTFYISYEMLYASDSCSGIGPTFRNTIVPLTDNNQLSSLLVFYGDVDYPDTRYSTVPFNLTDLVQTPIPVSVYNKDPKCAASSAYTPWIYHQISSSDWTNDVSFSCHQTAPYAPIIAVPEEVSNFDPAWKGCTAWYGGLYDPPIALTEATAEAMPTLPAAKPSNTPASPSSTTDNPATATVKPEASKTDIAKPTGKPVNVEHTNQPLESHAEASPTQPVPESQQVPSPTTPDPTRNPGGFIASIFGDDSTAKPAKSTHRGAPEPPPQSDSDSRPTEDPASLHPANAAQTQVNTAGESVLSIVQNYHPSASGEAVVNSQTIVRGEVATIAGHTVSVGSGGVVVNGPDGQTTVVPTAAPGSSITSPSAVVIGSSSITIAQTQQAGSTQVLVAQGGRIATIAIGSTTVLGGQTIVAGSSGEVMVGSVTVAATEHSSPEAAIATFTGSNGAAITIAEQGSAYVAAEGSSTLTIAPGSRTVANGHTISAPASGDAIIADGSTVTLPKSMSGESIVTFNGKTMTLQAENEIINSMTLTQGGEAKTVDGVEISMGPNGLVMSADGTKTTMNVVTGNSTGSESTTTSSKSPTTTNDSSTRASSSRQPLSTVSNSSAGRLEHRRTPMALAWILLACILL